MVPSFRVEINALYPQRCRPKTHGCVTVDHKKEFGSANSSEMVAALSAENIMLKQELDRYYRKVSKLQKVRHHVSYRRACRFKGGISLCSISQVEDEVCKVHGAHEELVKSAERREKLERAVRVRLDLEIKRLQENNKRLKRKFHFLFSSPSPPLPYLPCVLFPQSNWTLLFLN